MLRCHIYVFDFTASDRQDYRLVLCASRRPVVGVLRRTRQSACRNRFLSLQPVALRFHLPSTQETSTKKAQTSFEYENMETDRNKCELGEITAQIGLRGTGRPLPRPAEVIVLAWWPEAVRARSLPLRTRWCRRWTPVTQGQWSAGSVCVRLPQPLKSSGEWAWDWMGGAVNQGRWASPVGNNATKDVW